MQKKSIILITILTIISAVLLIVNFSIALFYDKTEHMGIVQFSQHKLDIEIVGGDSVILTPGELTIGAESTRTINIENPANSTSCVLRIWIEFSVENEIDNNYLSLIIDNENFSVNEFGKYYYNSVLQNGGKINNLVLKFKVSNNLVGDYQGKQYSMKLCIESIQANKEAVSEWDNDYSIEWYNNIKNSLS